MPIKKSAFIAAIDDYHGSVAQMEFLGRDIDEHLERIDALRKARAACLRVKLAAMEVLKRSMTDEAYAELVGYRDLQHG